MDRVRHLDKTQLFFDTVMKLRSLEECRDFFEDICTPAELSAIAHRMLIAKMLLDGATYLEIQDEAGGSTSLINRTRIMLEQGHRTVEDVLLRGSGS